MIIILSAEEFKEGLGSKERHVIYGFVIIVAMFLQVLFRVAYPDVSFISKKGGNGRRDEGWRKTRVYKARKFYAYVLSLLTRTYSYVYTG